ncbi:MAG: cytochrome bc complex cytochrome b subunit [Gammaproteobacteria bacterium]|nr:cytochrome bc complex cytochrome b subunit [Gammaproteobacteria bacterium]NNK99793.1 cytochrome bc complex cytochrome b subunit [Xanthomonadales bacterium]
MANSKSRVSSGANALLNWFDDRLPVSKFWKATMTGYIAPKNFNFWYYLGSLALLVLVIQIFSGILLAMHYKPSATEAFASVEYIMRDVEWGWLIRYMHTTGASFFFIVIYLHMFRSLLYGSHKAPRELLWVFGMFIYVALMAEAFLGYILPWGQMSYWGAQVIINLFGALPGIGEPLTQWIRGDYFISDATLNRFFALHVIAVPLALFGLILLHLVALRENGSNNPDGIDIKKNKDADGNPVDGIPFHPYYTIKDIFGVGFFLILFSFILFFWPEAGGLFLEHDNFIPADPLVTPEHIKPVWYFTPFYAILKAVPDKLLGVLTMGASVGVLFLLPWLDRSPVRSIRYKGLWYKILLGLFTIAFIRLGLLGMAEGTPAQTWEMRFWTLVYFMFFVLLFFISPKAKTKPEPDRVTH